MRPRLTWRDLVWPASIPDDPEETAMRRIVVVFGLAGGVFGMIGHLTNLGTALGQEQFFYLAHAMAGAVILTTAPLLLWWTQRVRLTAAVYICFGSSHIAYLCYIGGGVLDPTFPFFVTSAVSVSLTLGWRGASLYAAFLLGAVLLLALGPESAERAWFEAYVVAERRGMVVQTILVMAGYLALCALIYQTEMSRAAQALTVARNAAQAANLAKGRFLANMSHEIRTPMNGMLGMAQLLNDTELNEEQKGYAQTLLDSGEMLLVVLNDVLDVSKIEAGKLELEETNFSPRLLIEQVVSSFNLAAEAKGLKISQVLDAALPAVVAGDAARLRQVLCNLVGNAVKFTETGQVTLAVSVVPGETAGAQTLRFAVRDTGIGIDASRVDQIFDAFTQAEASTTRRYGGTGLGLSISSKLVELMGGRLTVQSRPGLGSEFAFFLALPAVSEEVSLSNPAAPLPAAGPQPLSSIRRVLVAEDNPVNRRVVGKLLSNLVPAVDFAPDGERAVECCRTTAYDLVFMDISMPLMDGLEATQVLGKSEGFATPATVPILALTAHALEEEREKAFSVGLDDYLLKPIDKQVLRDALRVWDDRLANGWLAGEQLGVRSG